MKFQLFLTALLLRVVFAQNALKPKTIIRNASKSESKVEIELKNLGRVYPPEVQTQDGRDCGTFIFYCGYKDSADACNNACYDIECRNGDTTFRRETNDNKNKRNRINSGCKAKGGSPCRNNLFAQTFSYDQKIGGGLVEPTCDEWPPAAVKQPSLSARGRKVNSLRCMEKSANSEAGAQLSGFLNEAPHPSGPQNRKSCEGKVEDGDYFRVHFNLSNTQSTNTYYCPQAGLQHNCEFDDSFQFHLTHRGAGNGLISNPYAFGTDNHYALEGKNNIKQCVIRMTREETDQGVSYFFKVSFQNDDGSGTGKPLAQKTVVPMGETIILTHEATGLDSSLKLHPNGDGIDTDVIFHYDNLQWKLSAVTNLGDGKTAKWCKEENGKPNTNNYLCTFPCTNGKGK